MSLKFRIKCGPEGNKKRCPAGVEDKPGRYMNDKVLVFARLMSVGELRSSENWDLQSAEVGIGFAFRHKNRSHGLSYERISPAFSCGELDKDIDGRDGQIACVWLLPGKS
jgi:hypothetical protein